METWEQFTRGLVEKMGFRDYKVEVDEEHHSASIVVYDAAPAFKEFIPSFVESTKT
jgi:hypothetical protein